MGEASEKRILTLILALFILLGLTYAVVTPVFEASDELWHYPMIRHLADGNPLPVQVYDPALAGPWKQEASQPPLYYYLGAALTFWIDTSDMEEVRWENPHVDNGLITADGNNNLVIHDPAANPWRGTLLAVRIVRIFSVFLGAATVYLTYRIGREVAPTRPEIALGAAAVNAFMPMFLFISGAVNNDNLAIPLASLALLLMIRLVGRAPATDDRRGGGLAPWLLLGVVIGLALLTKEGTFGLLPLAGGTTFIVAWRRRKADWTGAPPAARSFPGKRELRFLAAVLPDTLLRFGLILMPAALIAGWWYWRNVQLYGDFLGWSAFIAVLGQRAQPASLAQLWGERWGFMLSYWGLFGGVNIPMWTWIYRLLNAVLIVSLFGFAVYLLKQLRQWWLERGRRPSFGTWPLAALLNLIESRFPLVVCLLFSAAVVYGLIQWATTTWSSQGRLVFTAISTLSALLVVGWAGWLPSRPARVAVFGLASFLFVIAAAAPFLWIRPAYQPGRYTAPWLVPKPINVNFGDKLRLVGYEIGRTAAAQDDTTVQPGEVVDVMLEWEVLEHMDRDWSVFVHLIDPVLGVPIAQRDMYLDQGLRPASLLVPGERIFNHYRLLIPETAVSPADLQLSVGLYDFYTCPACERLPVVGSTTGRDAAVLARLLLEPAPGEFPNATLVNFHNEVELLGYEVEPRRAQPGETVNLTLYWSARRPLATDYTVFAQVVNLQDTTRWASQDSVPAPPTSAWRAAEVQTMTLALTLAENTPADVYPIILGLYTRTADGGFNRLQLVAEDGRITQDDFLQLTLLRVEDDETVVSGE